MSRKSKREALSPELTPMIDIVFLLLIFFLVTSVFKKNELALLLNLPKSQQGESADAKEKLVSIELSDTDLAIDGTKISIEELPKKLAPIEKKSIINLRVDGSVKYQRLVTVLDALQKNKLENVSLITEKGKLVK
ncbi:MAG: biopolymer transporter ExbD [Bacteriovoracaceae bacterium]|nr:biopolymer transporter ExbD [Bacteriovoracaceae bacterium]